MDNPELNYRTGSLPHCAPLAMAYVPMQDSPNPSYNSAQALSRGTLFPGLDLPFMNMVNTGDLTGTPLGELMALDFVAHELHLYLDTHPDDEEAFEMFRKVSKLAETARDKYTKLYGPISPADIADSKSFTWLKNPWPWDYSGRSEG